MSELSVREQAIYLYALRMLAGIGPKYVLTIARTIPQLQTISELSPMELKEILGASLGEKLHKSLTIQWKKVFPIAQSVIDQHFEKEVFPLPITCDDYPILLKQIEDAPIILYTKGNCSIFNNTHFVAIVGTREPTVRGIDTARQIASQCAKRGYVIVSGLAKGIDTAAHQGAITAGGKTIAVFATPIDKVYPAENRKLAEQIANESGVLVSELPLGTASWKGAFVERDRIQSGLSLSVIPVQTGIEGGTMHTVRFAQAQRRLIFCPVPPEEEKRASQYEGIWWLLSQKKAYSFKSNQPEIYERLLVRLEEQSNILLEHVKGTPSHRELIAEQPDEVVRTPDSTEQITITIEHSLAATASDQKAVDQDWKVTEQASNAIKQQLTGQTMNVILPPLETTSQSQLTLLEQLSETDVAEQWLQKPTKSVPMETKTTSGITVEPVQSVNMTESMQHASTEQLKEVTVLQSTLIEQQTEAPVPKKKGKAISRSGTEQNSKLERGKTKTTDSTRQNASKPKRVQATKTTKRTNLREKSVTTSKSAQMTTQDSAQSQDTTSSTPIVDLWNVSF